MDRNVAYELAGSVLQSKAPNLYEVRKNNEIFPAHLYCLWYVNGPFPSSSHPPPTIDAAKSSPPRNYAAIAAAVAMFHIMREFLR